MITCDTNYAELKINEKPDYLSEDFFLTSDAKNKKISRRRGNREKFMEKMGVSEIVCDQLRQ